MLDLFSMTVDFSVIVAGLSFLVFSLALTIQTILYEGEYVGRAMLFSALSTAVNYFAMDKLMALLGEWAAALAVLSGFYLFMCLVTLWATRQFPLK